MERVTDERIADMLDGLLYNKHSVIEALKELQARREAEKEQGHTDNSASEKDGAVLPIPCTKGYEEWTVKQWFAKINEELDEMKEAMLRWSDLDSVSLDCDYVEKSDIALVDEAADTITAITSMLEAMGIDEQARQAAQRRVNNNNRQRGRF